MSNPLKPCPFCGSDRVATRPVVYAPDGPRDQCFVVECSGCNGWFHMGGKSHDLSVSVEEREKDAEDRWNRRAST